MRNLEEYPITKKELVDCLYNLAEEIVKSGGIGDMRPLLLSVAADIIEKFGPDKID